METKDRTKILLSICIPTFNRKQTLITNIKNLLSSKENRFQIVIQDNASTDGTENAISEFKDTRIIYSKNEKNIGGTPSSIRALSNNSSEYSMLLLDKDFINVKELSNFLDILDKEKPDFGYINLDIENINATYKVDAGLNGIKEFGFLSKHPTGYFFRSNLWDECVNSTWFNQIDTLFPFVPDCVMSSLAIKYKGIVVGNPIINAAYKTKSDGSKSLTYTNANMWFFPKMLDERMNTYTNVLFSQECDIKSMCVGLNKIFRQNLIGKTISYKHLMSDSTTCEHYNIQMKNIGLAEMVKNLKESCTLFKAITKTHLKDIQRYKIVAPTCLMTLLNLLKISAKERISFSLLSNGGKAKQVSTQKLSSNL